METLGDGSVSFSPEGKRRGRSIPIPVMYLRQEAVDARTVLPISTAHRPGFGYWVVSEAGAASSLALRSVRYSAERKVNPNPDDIGLPMYPHEARHPSGQ